MSQSKDRITGIVIATFSVLYLYFSKDIRVFRGSGATPLTSAFMPRFWGTCLLLLSAILIIRGGRKLVRPDGGDPGTRRSFSPGEFFRNNYEVILTFVFIGMYVAMLAPLGFTLSSALYIFAQILVLTPPGKRNPKLALVVGVVAAFTTDFLFVRLLGVLLPHGIFGF